MHAIHVQIDISTPTGRRLLKEVERHPRVAIVEYPLPENNEKQDGYTVDAVFDECIEILSKHYQTDCKKIWNDIK